MAALKKLLGNWFVKDVILMIVILLSISLAVNILLSFVTAHNKEIAVPDFGNMTLSEARSAADEAGIRVEVMDSVYRRHSRKGVVYTQLPEAGSKVKRDRRVMLTMVATGSRKVYMPSLVGFSMRRAKAELGSRDLVLGRLIYVNDIATNNVLRQLYRNAEIKPGTEINAGSRIDLVVGLSEDDAQTTIPNLMTMKYERALDMVRDNSMNLGRIVFDRSVKTFSDTLNARVARQVPESDGTQVPKGSEMSLYFSLDK